MKINDPSSTVTIFSVKILEAFFWIGKGKVFSGTFEMGFGEMPVLRRKQGDFLEWVGVSVSSGLGEICEVG